MTKRVATSDFECEASPASLCVGSSGRLLSPFKRVYLYINYLYNSTWGVMAIISSDRFRFL